MITTGIIGDTIYITGSGLYDISAVVFGSETTGSFKETNGGLFVTIPKDASWGTVRIESYVRGISGNSQYLFVPQPEITGFFPATGIPGTLVTISGFALSGVTGIQFNNLNSTTVVQYSNFGLTAVLPSGNTKGFIKAIGQSGLSSLSKSEFYASALITGLSATGGLAGSYLEISGINFLTELMYQANSALDSYYVGFNDITGEFFRVNNRLLTGLVPDNASSGILTIYKNASDSHYSDYIYNVARPNPLITGIMPLTGIAGQDIIIRGSNFFNIGTLNFEDGYEDDHFIQDEPTTIISYLGNTIYAKIPETAGPGYATIYTPTSNHFASLYVLGKPIILGFDAYKGLEGDELRITGYHLYPESKIYLDTKNSKPLTYVGKQDDFSLEHSILIVSLPAVTNTERTIIIDNVAATVVYSGLTFASLQPPIITGLSINSGSWMQSVSVLGSGMSSITGVVFGETNLFLTGDWFDNDPLWERIDNTQILIYIPINSHDSYVNVSNEAGTSYSTGIIYVTPPAIVISGMAPNPIEADKVVTVSGVNMNFATGMLFSGQSGQILYGRNFLVNITGSASAIVPLGATTNRIRIMHRGGRYLSPMNLEIFTRPTISGLNPLTATYGETLTISGSNFTGTNTQFFFSGPEGENVITTNTTIVSASLATTKVPSGIVSSNLIVSGWGNYSISTSYFSPIPFITGFVPTGTGTRGGDYFVITGINCYNVTGLVMSGSGRCASIIDSPLIFTHLPGYSITTGYLNGEFQGTGRLAFITSGYDFYLNKPLPSNFFSNRIFRTTGAIPTISGISPNTGYSTTLFSISGNNLLKVSLIQFASYEGDISSFAYGVVNSKLITGNLLAGPTAISGNRFLLTHPYSTFKVSGNNDITYLSPPYIGLVTPTSDILTGTSVLISNSNFFQSMYTGYLRDSNGDLIGLRLTGLSTTLGVTDDIDEVYAMIPRDGTLTDKDYDLLLVNPVGTGVYSTIQIVSKRTLDRNNYLDTMLYALSNPPPEE